MKRGREKGIWGVGATMRKILIPVLNRASYGRPKSVIKAVYEHPQLELQLVTGASVFDWDIEYPVAYRVQCMVEGDNLAIMPLTTSMWITQLTSIIENLNPDIVYLHGDRYEQLGTALTTAYMGKVLTHGEGGEISSCIDNKVRHAVSQLADIHFPVTELSAQRLINMGISPDKIFVVGSTALDSLVGIDLSNTRKEPYIVVLMHPNTTCEESIEPLIEALDGFDMPKLWCNPNVDPGNKALLKRIHRQKVEFVKNLPLEEYARLIKNCACLVGNTSSGIKEGAFLGAPYVCVGKRQEGREHAPNCLMVANNWQEIYLGMCKQINTHYEPNLMFGDGTAGKKVADILAKI